MSEYDRLMQLLDEYIASAGPAFAHSMKTRDLKALRALLVALAQNK